MMAAARNNAELAARFLLHHEDVETRPRTVCAECQFETPEREPESHAPGCSRKETA